MVEGVGGTIGSGSSGISSLADAVSIVICVVGFGGRPQGVQNWRAFYCHRRLLVSRQMGHRRLVEASACIDINGISYVVSGLAGVRYGWH